MKLSINNRERGLKHIVIAFIIIRIKITIVIRQFFFTVEYDVRKCGSDAKFTTFCSDGCLFDRGFMLQVCYIFHRARIMISLCKANNGRYIL